jgi:hypothetical protein
MKQLTSEHFAWTRLERIRKEPLKVLSFRMANPGRFGAELLGCNPDDYRYRNPVPCPLRCLSQRNARSGRENSSCG